jgi:hypothetical protein
MMLGAAALVGLLESEARGAIPETLLPSIMTASNVVATGVAAGAGTAGGTAMTLANEIMKAMLWAKVKLATAAVATAVVVGSGMAGIYWAQASGGPATAPREEQSIMTNGTESAVSPVPTQRTNSAPATAIATEESKDAIRFGRLVAQLAVLFQKKNPTAVDAQQVATMGGELSRLNDLPEMMSPTARTWYDGMRGFMAELGIA